MAYEDLASSREGYGVKCFVVPNNGCFVTVVGDHAFADKLLFPRMRRMSQLLQHGSLEQLIVNIRGF